MAATRRGRDRMSSEARSRVMRSIRGRDTGPELAFRDALDSVGILGYRRNDGTLPGTPDFAFRSANVAVFVDGDFWHGSMMTMRQIARGQLQPKWKLKIMRNKAMDGVHDELLKSMGWKPIRLPVSCLEGFCEEYGMTKIAIAATMVKNEVLRRERGLETEGGQVPERGDGRPRVREEIQ